ncbi:MAG: DUF4178 domain-containing protein [Polyangiales bacterium]
MSRQVPCPNCGAPIEFKMGSAAVLACPYCRACVMRTGTNLQTLGQLADLVPTSPPLGIGDTANMLGGEIVVGGRMQLDHGKGPWDEWYVENTQTRQWAWLAKAQGRWYYTVPLSYEGSVPTFEQMAPGQRGSLPGVQGEWTVAERGSSTVLTAEGELPYVFQPNVPGRYVDLSNAEGGFATIDYGNGQEPPKLFVGRKLSHEEFSIGQRRGAGSPVAEKVEAKRLRCPTCGDAVPVLAPEATERVVCGSCSSLLDYQNGDLAMLKQLEQARAKSPIPLGTEGTLGGQKVTVIGFMERCTKVDYVVYRWREFLLYVEGQGFWWLLEDNGHFQLIRPLEAGEVNASKYSQNAKYKNDSFPIFSRVNAWVETVVGEFYWKVESGEEASLCDYVSPPYVLSSELTNTELNWSIGEHIDGADVWAGLGLDGKPPYKRGVGIVQPNPYSWKGTVIPLVATVLLCVLAAFTSGGGTVVDGSVQTPPTSMTAPDASGRYAMLTPPFAISSRTVLGVHLGGNPSNQFVGAACALINEETREVIEFELDFGAYNGVDGGYRWSEGTLHSDVNIDSVPAGNYRMRIDPFWTAYPQPGGQGGIVPPNLRIQVNTNDRSPWCFLLSLLMLLAPAFFNIARQVSFETQRKENSTV